jgi:hypothetical protein
MLPFALGRLLAMGSISGQVDALYVLRLFRFTMLSSSISTGNGTSFASYVISKRMCHKFKPYLAGWLVDICEMISHLLL